MAGHLGLGRLIVLYDSNNVTIDGDTSLSFTENVIQRFNAYGWHTQTVKDGDKDLTAILQVGQDKSVWEELGGNAESTVMDTARDGLSSKRGGARRWNKVVAMEKFELHFCSYPPCAMNPASQSISASLGFDIFWGSPICDGRVLYVQAIRKAKAVTDRPSLIEIKTTIGWGSQNEGTEKVHGAPLGADDIKQLKAKLGLNPNETFQVPEETRKVGGSSAFMDSLHAFLWIAASGLLHCRITQSLIFSASRRGVFVQFPGICV